MVLEITSTLPKGLGKKDNIKAFLRQQPRGKQLLPPSAVDSRKPGEEMKIHPLHPSPTLISFNRPWLGDNG